MEAGSDDAGGRRRGPGWGQPGHGQAGAGAHHGRSPGVTASVGQGMAGRGGARLMPPPPCRKQRKQMHNHLRQNMCPAHQNRSLANGPSHPRLDPEEIQMADVSAGPGPHAEPTPCASLLVPPARMGGGSGQPGLGSASPASLALPH